jgi:RNA polymerase sigma-70 factor, ECF subfamily
MTRCADAGSVRHAYPLEDAMGTTWEEFVKLHAQGVLDSALRVTGHAADAEDVAQDVFMEIFRSGKLQEYSTQPALLRTIATRRALDRLRRRKAACDLSGEERDAREHEPSDYAIATEMDHRFRSALAKLPTREAEVFCMSVLEGSSATEIAGLLNISKGAVAKSLSMARGRLATLFGDVQSETKR